MSLLELRLQGPFTQLPGKGAIFQIDEAWRPGLWLQTILFNHSDRVQRVGYADSSVCHAMADQLRASLIGELEIFSADARTNGVLERVYDPEGTQSIANVGDAVAEEIAARRLFFAPLSDAVAGEAITIAVLQHLRTLGGKAAAWLTADNAVITGKDDASRTVRFYRPVHMASVPDELRY